MMLRGFTSPSEYAQFLERDRAEAEALYRDVLINVTSFFRDPEMFEALKRAGLPGDRQRQGRTDRRSASGCRAARPARRRTRSPWRCWSSSTPPRASAVDSDLRHRSRRPGVPRQGPRRASTRKASKRKSVPSGCGGFSSRRIATIAFRRACATCCVFARQNVTVDPPFSRVDLVTLPQRADLHVPAAAGTAVAGVSLRPESRRLPGAGPGRNGRRVRRPVRADESRAQDLSPEGDGAAVRRSPSWRTSGWPARRRRAAGASVTRPADFQREADRLIARALRAAQRARERRLRGPAIPRADVAVPRSAERPADHQHPAHGQGRACSWSCGAP